MMERNEWRLHGEDDTVQFGSRLAKILQRGCVIYLRGDLGAGKTTLVRGLLHTLGHKGAVKSPTYTLVEPYSVAGFSIFHFDLYRLGSPEELEFMGIRDYFTPESICLVEWPERGSGFLPEADLIIELIYESAGERRVQVTGQNERGRRLLHALHGAQSA